MLGPELGSSTKKSALNCWAITPDMILVGWLAGCFLNIGSHCVAQAGFELAILMPGTEMMVCSTSTNHITRLKD